MLPLVAGAPQHSEFQLKLGCRVFNSRLHIVCTAGTGKVHVLLQCKPHMQGACEKASDWLVALSLFTEMKHKKPSSIVQHLGPCGSMHLLRHVPLNVIAYSAAIRAFGKAGEWQMASALFREMAVNKAAGSDLAVPSTWPVCELWEGHPRRGKLQLHDQCSRSRGTVALGLPLAQCYGT